MKRLKALTPLAPLHQPHNLAAIRAVMRLRNGLPQIGCFDTAFHHDMPRLATLMALPRNLGEEGMRRYGFHGLTEIRDEQIRRLERGKSLPPDSLLFDRLYLK